MSGVPRIAALVCTYNRSKLLRLCLDGLLSQTLAPADFEVVVVDNNSSDDTPDVIADFTARYPNFRGVTEPQQGLSAARNKALEVAAASIVAFIDDDAVPEPDWLSRLIDRFGALDDDVAMVGGDVDPMWESARPNWLTQPMERAISASLNWSTYPRFVDGRDEWLFEGASAYRKAPLLALGGFPQHLGRVGNLLLSGEAALHLLLADQGARFFYDPTIRVKHLIAADRLTKEWFRRRYFWQGVTGFHVNAYLKQHGAGAAHTTRVDLPVSEGAWLDAFDDEASDFGRALSTMYHLGYLLAAQGVVVAR